MTDAEMVADYPVLSRYLDRPYATQSPSGLRTRRSELVEKGYVEATGLKVLPRGRNTGRRAMFFWAI